MAVIIVTNVILHATAYTHAIVRMVRPASTAIALLANYAVNIVITVVSKNAMLQFTAVFVTAMV